MPELPEVETIRRGLKNRITGQKILDVAVLSPKNFIGRHADFAADKAELIGKTIESIDRRGKALLLNLSNKLTLMVHLRMTGQLIYVPATGDSPTTRFAGGHPNESFLDSLPNKQTRVVLKLTQGTLFFNDQRKFGLIKVVATDDVANDPFVSKLAPEPWDYDLEDWRQTLSRRQAPIKAVLLNQELIAGLGNIYADESLFAAHIHPARPANTLSRQEAKRLLQALLTCSPMALKAITSTNLLVFTDAPASLAQPVAQPLPKPASPVAARVFVRIASYWRAKRDLHFLRRTTRSHRPGD